MVGIAGGAPHEDFTISDVILASEILDFQYQVTHDNRPSELHPRTRALHRSSHAIVAIFPAIRRQIPQWASEQEIAAQRPHPPTRDQIKTDVPPDYLPLIKKALDYHLTHPRNYPVAIPGTIGSGNELLKSVEFLYQLIRGNRQLLSIEMESAGAIAACNTGTPVPMLTIRGISDIVGVDRSATWTEYACKGAASLAIHLIRSGYLMPPDESSLQQVDTVPAAEAPSTLETTISSAGTLTSTCLAVRNIQRFGDTDIFPKPFEIGLFRDLEVDTCALIDRVDAEFAGFFPRNPPSHVSTLSQIGYTGFRWASQLDPLYNAYLLSLVLRIAPMIEVTRVPIASGRVFSYRLNIDERGKLFDEDGTWDSFQRTSRERAERSAWVVKTDIADFYSRIPHEKLHSALESIQRGHHSNARVIAILLEYSKNSGVGLPVGGPAARILSEAYLSASDRVLLAKGINYCRYADDYLIFTDSEREAIAALRELATLLSEYESLSLQKLKTRVMRKSEYLRTYTHEADDELDRKAISFCGFACDLIHIRLPPRRITRR